MSAWSWVYFNEGSCLVEGYLRYWLKNGEAIQLGKAVQCLRLPTTCSGGYCSVDSNLTSGTINGDSPGVMAGGGSAR